MIKKLLLLIILFFQTVGFSQNPALSEIASVSIFTCGRGNELYSTFGHTAIRIKDSINNLDVVYNYGAFDFRTENFYLKFVKGDLQYFINATSYDDFIFEYQTDNREVIEQTLSFPLAKKQELFELLNTSLFSEERNYTYKFIDRNCTTMVVEKINAIVGKKLIEKVDDKSISFRDLLYPYFDNHFYYKLGINIIFGAKTDAKAEKLFLPIELLNCLDKAKIENKPLVVKKETLIKGAELTSSFSFINSIYFIALILLVIALINNKYVSLSYLFLSGLLGIFLCLVGLYSDHKEVLWNYNALLFNPIYIILGFLGSSWFRKMANVCFAMTLVYIVIMIGKPHLSLMIPFILANNYILYKFGKARQKS